MNLTPDDLRHLFDLRCRSLRDAIHLPYRDCPPPTWRHSQPGDGRAFRIRNAHRQLTEVVEALAAAVEEFDRVVTEPPT